MKINNAGLKILQDFEGLRLKAYKCPAGVWTIGYGSTGEGIGPGVVWTLDQAIDRLKRDLAEFEEGVTRLTNNRPLTENQFSALVVFVYNVGLGAFKTSTMLKKIKAGHVLDAADEFARWNRAAGKILTGLTRRRLAERALYVRA